MTSGQSRVTILRTVLAGTLVLAGSLPVAPTRADIGLLPPPPPIPVDVFSVKGKLAETAEIDSNPLLLPGAVKSFYGSITAPEIVFGAEMPSLTLDDDTRANINRFNQGNLNSDDLHSVSHALWRGQTYQFGVTANADSDTTRTSEVAASGLNLAGISHHGFTITPLAVWLPDPIDSLQISAFASGSFYQVHALYEDYRVYGVTPTYQHSFDEKNAGLVQVQVSRFETVSGARTTIDQLQPAVGWGTTLTPQLTVTGNVGLQRTYWKVTDNLASAVPATTGVAFLIDIGYAGEQDTLHLTSSRQPNPTGVGTEIETTQVTIVNKFMITPKLEFDMNITYQKSVYGPNSFPYQRNYLSSNPVFLYHMTDQTDMSLGYQYRQQALFTTNQVPTSDAMMLTLTYSPTAFAGR